MTFDPAPLADAACDALRQLGPLTPADLVPRLDSALFDPETPIHERAEDVESSLMDSDRVTDLPGGRMADIDSLTWGLVLTHRITERELALEGVDLEPDLGPLLAFLGLAD